MKIKPFNNMVLCQLIKGDGEGGNSTRIVLPERQVGRFIKIKILDTGGEVNPGIKIGSVCIANALFETIDPAKPEIGFINSKDILGRID